MHRADTPPFARQGAAKRPPSRRCWTDRYPGVAVEEGSARSPAARCRRSKQGNEIPLNNNRNNNNNRRRGRGNNRGGGNPNQSNRIDSRARGNAPQMLDKYKKLAQEAQLNDDRVQTEYYLQFADHYFRVMADMKAVKDDQRPRRDGERDSEGSDDDYDSDSDDGYSRQEERNQDRDEYRRNARPRNDEKRNDDKRNDDKRNDDKRNDDNRRDDGRRTQEPRPVPGSEGESGDQTDDDNPFTRDAPKPRQRKPRDDKPRDDRPREDRSVADKPARRARKSAETEDMVENDGGLDPDMLPPSIARTLAADDSDDVADEAPKPRRRLPPRRNRDQGNEDGSGDGALEAVG
ncbi:MAG: DUF4167 domain-containing protein [Erythrobacter sp.]|nr:MAG: DUF4167 domain-containing protein [Erythrobacter sp.]